MIIDGRALASEVLARAEARAARLPTRPQGLWDVASGPTPPTRSYLKIKERSAEAAGCDFEETKDPADFVKADAGIIQLPVPAGFLLDVIPLEKDADVLSSSARASFESDSSTPGVNAISQTPGVFPPLLPPVVGAVKKILEFGKVEIVGKKAVVVGAGFLVGAPVAIWLKQQGAEVEVATLESEKYRSLTSILKMADIVVSGAGSPHFIKPEMLKNGVVLVDAGTAELGGKVAGDADPARAEVCSIFTPVPGGVDPLAVA